LEEVGEAAVETRFLPAAHSRIFEVLVAMKMGFGLLRIDHRI
jgi:hypothetical protein